MTLQEQIALAVDRVKGMFDDSEFAEAQLPEDATREQLWAQLIVLKKELHGLKRAKRGVKPKVEDAVRLLLEDADLTGVPVSVIAEIIATVFRSYGLKCNTSEESIRWYMSQRNLQWDIRPRTLPPVPKVELAVKP